MKLAYTVMRGGRTVSPPAVGWSTSGSPRGGLQGVELVDVIAPRFERERSVGRRTLNLPGFH